MIEKWRDRLRDAIEASGKSNTRIAKEAGLSHGYLTGIFRDGKEPGFDKVIAIADVVGVSMAYILFGMELNREQERLLRLYGQLDEKQQNALLDLISRGSN